MPPRSLECFDAIVVRDPVFAPDAFSSNLELETDQGIATFKVRYRYPEGLLQDDATGHQLARLTASTFPINYGLFARRIVYDFPLTPADHAMLAEMSERTASDVYVNRIVGPNPHLRSEFRVPPDAARPEEARPLATIESNGEADELRPWTTDPRRCAVMSSGGKESLLTLGVLERLGADVRPVFINESGHHWLTAVGAFRAFRETGRNPLRVWTTSDRAYRFINRHMRILDPETFDDPSDIYPVQLFTFQNYLFAAMPIVHRIGAGNLLMGSEYDEEPFPSLHGIPHYNAVLDQTQWYDSHFSRYYDAKGWNVRQWSLVRPISGLVVQRILGQEFPELFALQRSCHAVHVGADDAIRPCARCSKCLGVMSFMLASGVDPTVAGYSTADRETLPARLAKTPLRLDPKEREHTMALLRARGILAGGTQDPLPFPEAEFLHFDEVRSDPENVPPVWRDLVHEFFLDRVEGVVWGPTGAEEKLSVDEARIRLGARALRKG